MNAKLRRRHGAVTAAMVIGLPLAFAAAVRHGASRSAALDGRDDRPFDRSTAASSPLIALTPTARLATTPPDRPTP